MLVLLVWSFFQDEQKQFVGKSAPLFDARQLNAEEDFSLIAHRGQVVVINFWGSWCGPCRVEAPLLQNIYEDYQTADFVLVGVAVQDSPSSARAYLKDFGVSYPNVLDSDGSIQSAYHARGIPQTFIINRQGVVERVFIAQPRAATLREAIEAALNEP